MAGALEVVSSFRDCAAGLHIEMPSEAWLYEDVPKRKSAKVVKTTYSKLYMSP